MNKSLVLKNKLYLFFILLTSFLIFMYFLYFLISGPRGVISYYKVKNFNSLYVANFSQLNQKNQYFVDRVRRLQTNTIDLDFLDEKIREKTGYIDNNELMITFD